jgi:RecA/RadA recombinase
MADFQLGRITEITGLEASGKSLLAAHTLAETQKKVVWQSILILKQHTVQSFYKQLA